MVSRALHGRLKDTMDALTQLKRIADDALVLSPEDASRSAPSARRRAALARENASDAGLLSEKIPEVPGRAEPDAANVHDTDGKRTRAYTGEDPNLSTRIWSACSSPTPSTSNPSGTSSPDFARTNGCGRARGSRARFDARVAANESNESTLAGMEPAAASDGSSTNLWRCGSSVLGG